MKETISTNFSLSFSLFSGQDFFKSQSERGDASFKFISLRNSKFHSVHDAPIMHLALIPLHPSE
jgi:hypothetical protein